MILTLSFNLFARDKNCKYAENKIDAFSKKRIVKTMPETLFVEKQIYIGATVLNTNLKNTRLTASAVYVNGKHLILFLLDNSDNADQTGDYSSLEILLNTDEVIQFFKPTSEGTDNKDGITHWKYYLINDRQWTTFKTTPISKIRINYEDNTKGDFEIRKKNVNAISNIINCIDDLNLPISPAK